ncbi:sigma-70 family RNA polymerase sigma factor [Sandarakinorhabdus sp.]|uniref:RNA polymerase sigma factor n=1 Tax=Sandarakinorhabdus sp. TaxID=1916663 RepID=UPI00286E2086|nr:sigma-70 family RNA polymerase sigma factor [Sandarakinorhabdus sp.]
MDAPAPGSAPPAATLATALMLRVAQGDSAAFTQLVRLLERPALALAYRTLMNRAGAEDVCQQAFTRLWTHGPRFDPARGNAEAWFRRILVNLCLDRRRAIRPVQPLDAAAELADHRPDPEAAAIRADGQARLEAAMARLNPRQRLALSLFHGEGQSMAEIAAQMDTTAKAVEGLLGRARSELRTLMNESLIS